MSKVWKTVMRRLRNICMVDKFLLLYLLILFLYTGISLLTSKESEPHAIDVVVRTSLASIFGYFLSSNFKKPVSAPPLQAPNRSLSSGSTDSLTPIQNQIGFEIPSAGVEQGSVSTQTEPQTCCHTQVVIVSIIGLISLSILLLTRQLPDVSALSAIRSQLRDFVSACIGFLVSCKKYPAA